MAKNWLIWDLNANRVFFRPSDSVKQDRERVQKIAIGAKNTFGGNYEVRQDI